MYDELQASWKAVVKILHIRDKVVHFVLKFNTESLSVGKFDWPVLCEFQYFSIFTLRFRL